MFGVLNPLKKKKIPLNFKFSKFLFLRKEKELRNAVWNFPKPFKPNLKNTRIDYGSWNWKTNLLRTIINTYNLRLLELKKFNKRCKPQ